MAKRQTLAGQARIIESQAGEIYQLTERLAALELALDADGWRLLAAQSDQEFSREGLRQIAELCRLMYLKNPLVQRGVDVKRLYVWGQGWSVKAGHDDVNAVLTAFIDDPKNQTELTSHAARMQKEVERQTDGNIFLVFFTNAATGRVRVRSIPCDEIDSIICDPDDAKSPRYYRRTWTVERFDMTTGAITSRSEVAYYPDWRFNPTNKPESIGQRPVKWGSPVYHIKATGYAGGSFGVSPIYATIDWAKAYKEFLEDWASIVRAYRRFAFAVQTPGGKSAIAAAKAKLGTTYGNAGTGAESNPAPTVGSTFVSSPDVSISPVRTAGATVAAEDGRRLLLMVAAAVGLPETFFGDVSVGTLATAESLDRPTELMMRDIQTLWADIHLDIFGYVLLQAVKAPSGPLRGLGTVITERDGDEVVETVEWLEDVDAHIDIDWPPIRAESVTERIGGIVSAATLDGKQLAGTLDIVTVTRMLLVALGEDDIDTIMEQLFPDGEAPIPETMQTQSEAIMIAAATELRDSLVKLREANSVRSN